MISYMQNRELSWLKFNERVLEKGGDQSIPLYERLKFVSIFESNLTEFFNVRVGSLTDLSELNNEFKDKHSAMTYTEQLDYIYKMVVPLYEKKDKIYKNLAEEFDKLKLTNYKYDDLDKVSKDYVNNYFFTDIYPMLSPNIISKRHPFPFLENNRIYIVAELNNKKKTNFLILPIRETLPEFINLPNSNGYILTEEIIFHFVEMLVPNYKLIDKYLIRVTRNADIDLENDSPLEDNYKEFVQKKIKNRRTLRPVRLEVNKKLSENTMNFLARNLNLKDNMIFITRSPIKMNYIWDLNKIIDKDLRYIISYGNYVPRHSEMIERKVSMIEQIEHHDMLLSYPYDSMNDFLDLLKEASEDRRVFSIKITLYRLAANSNVIKHLIRAAQNGKEVTVIVELKARFDEENNIDYSDELIAAGINVIYGMENYKVHTKVCLISYHKNGQVNYISHIGTGNYNETTAKIYQDMNIITANKYLTEDIANFFNNMQLGKVDNKYNCILQSPSTFKPKFIELINNEINKKEEGYLRFKCNSITDIDIIEKIVEASNSGVKIDMIVRGITCILPGVKGKTDNLEIRSIVGRYLEHARIYQFGKDKDLKLYIASADLMTRNTENRIELSIPVFDKEIKKYLIEFLDKQFIDTVNAEKLLENGKYKKIRGEYFNSHDYFMKNLSGYLAKRKMNLHLHNDKKILKDNAIDSKLSVEEIDKIKSLSFIEKIKLLFYKNL